MKKIHSIFLVPFLISSHIFAQTCPLPLPHQRDLVILPDTAGEESIKLLGFNAVNNFQTNQLEKVLYSQAAPCLIELSIWKRFAQKVKKEPKPWLEQTNYDFYTFGNYMLCIPIKWKAQFADTGFDLTKFMPVPSPLTLFPKFLDPIKGTFKSMLTLINVYSSLVKLLRTLLVPKNGSSNPFAWNIVLFGHGGPSPTGSYAARVAGIPFGEFKKLLQFLEHDITTNLLLYSTCYAGSRWLLKAYETKGKADVYHFPIVLTGISEAPVYSWRSLNEAAQYSSLFQKIKTIHLCKAHMNQLGFIAGILLQAIALTNQPNQYTVRSANNLLQVRWPKETQFQVLELTDLIQSAQALQKRTKKIDAAPIISKALVLDTPFLNRELLLSRPDHTITSGIPNKWHYISSIVLPTTKESPEESMSGLLGYFSSIKEPSSEKIFLIDRVSRKDSQTIAHNVMIFIHALSPFSYFFRSKKSDEIFYMIGDKGYRLVQGTPARVIGYRVVKGYRLVPVVDQITPLSARATKRHVKLFEEQKKQLLEEDKS